jgi:hypothetical protein
MLVIFNATSQHMRSIAMKKQGNTIYWVLVLTRTASGSINSIRKNMSSNQGGGSGGRLTLRGFLSLKIDQHSGFVS